MRRRSSSHRQQRSVAGSRVTNHCLQVRALNCAERRCYMGTRAAVLPGPARRPRFRMSSLTSPGQHAVERPACYTLLLVSASNGFAPKSRIYGPLERPTEKFVASSLDQGAPDTRRLSCATAAAKARGPQINPRPTRLAYGKTPVGLIRPRQIFGSKVRLEINIVADLAVDLQAIALAVSDDDLAGGRVEVNCRREAQAPQRL